MTRRLISSAVALALVLCLPATAHADARRAAGKTLLEKHCAHCHSIEAAGASPLAAAPPIRDIYVRHPTRELQEELAEGMVSKHKSMPQISFSDEDVAAILAYLYDLARAK
jgi:mono/diheme cytochrome c family protein